MVKSFLTHFIGFLIIFSALTYFFNRDYTAIEIVIVSIVYGIIMALINNKKKKEK